MLSMTTNTRAFAYHATRSRERANLLLLLLAELDMRLFMFLLSGISSRAIILQLNAEPTLHLEKAKNLLIIMVHSAVFHFNVSYNY